MLLTIQVLGWAYAYHGSKDKQFFIKYLNRVEELIRLSFSSSMNSSHESL